MIGLALLWVYFRRNEAFTRFRNTILLANVLGLHRLRLHPDCAAALLHVDRLHRHARASSAASNHGSGLVELASNPYAAMPSLHAADALIVGVILASVVAAGPSAKCSGCSGRRGSGSPSWRPATTSGWTSLAGIVLALIALAIVYRARVQGFIASLL